MKRLLLSIIAVVALNSCSTYVTNVTNYTGTITVLDSNGNTVKKWENITFQNDVDGHTDTNAFKMFGLNFYDPKSDKFVIISNAVPYIIEYNTTTYKVEYTPPTNNLHEERQALIEEYDKLQERIQQYKKALSVVDKNSQDYNRIKASIKETKAQMSQIQNILWKDYNYNAY